MTDFNFDINNPPTIVSVDFETLSLEADAVVIGFGAVAFKPGEEPKPLLSVFPVNAQGQLGRRADPDTVNWWSVRPEGALRLAYHRAMCGDGPPLHIVMQKFLELCASLGDNVWLLFKPSCFDGALLRHACAWSGLGPQLEQVFGGASRWRSLDLQSIRFGAAWAGVDVPDNLKPTVEHHPQLDADAQARSGDAILGLLRRAVSGGIPTVEQDVIDPFVGPHADGYDFRAAADAAEVFSYVIEPRKALEIGIDRLLRGETDNDVLAFLGRFARNVVLALGEENVVDGRRILHSAIVAAQRLLVVDAMRNEFLATVKRLLDVPSDVFRQAHDAALQEDPSQ